MGELFLHCAVAALVSFVVGFIWYNPKVFGNAWMNAAGLTEEKLRNSGRNMGVVFLLCYVFAFMAAIMIQNIVIHQMGVYSYFGDSPEKLKAFMDAAPEFETKWRTFKHGALHGTILGIFLALPMVAINAMFEMKSWKYIWINTGYWLVCFILMGGILSAWI